MSKFVAGALLVSTLVLAAVPAGAEPATPARFCPGVAVASFEQRVSGRQQRGQARSRRIVRSQGRTSAAHAGSDAPPL